MKLNFSFQFKGIDGTEFKGNENSAYFVLSDFIAKSNKGNAIKLWDMSLKIYNSKEIELDETDFNIVYALVESSELPIIVRAQILKYMDSVKIKKK